MAVFTNRMYYGGGHGVLLIPRDTNRHPDIRDNRIFLTGTRENIQVCATGGFIRMYAMRTPASARTNTYGNTPR